MRLGTIAVCAVALAACGGSDGGTKSPRGPSSPDQVERAHDDAAGGAVSRGGDPHEARDALYESLAEQIKDVDCPTYARTVQRWVAENQSEIRRLEARIDDPASIDEHLVNAFEVVMDGAADCVDSDEAQAAFDAFDELFMGG